MDDELITREYKCTKCGEKVEQKCSIKDPVLKIHKCGGELKSIIGKSEVLVFSQPLLGAISRRYA